jgi:hypothetical protein
MPRLYYLREKTLVHIEQRDVWAPESVRTGVKNIKTSILADIRSQDHPGRSIVTIPTELSRPQNMFLPIFEPRTIQAVA